MGIAAGTYDRQVSIYRTTRAQSDSGAVSEQLIALATNVWARMVPTSGNQTYEGEQRVSTDAKVFHVRYFGSPILQGYQLQYEDQMYLIQDVAELGRRVAYELRCITKDNL